MMIQQSAKMSILLIAGLCVALWSSACHGFSHPTDGSMSRIIASNTALFSTVIDAPTKEDLDRKVGRRKGGGNNNDNNNDKENIIPFPTCIRNNIVDFK